MKGVTLIGSTSAAVLLAGAALLFAGPLDPPSGPVSGTYKTLTEVEPRIAISSANTPGDATSLYKITKPGSYYLTGNVTGKSGRYGIYIEADKVTIDLSGFTLSGVAGSLDGIQGYEGIRDTTIRNGAVSGWARSGIYIGGGAYGYASGVHIEDVYASDNTYVGISARLLRRPVRDRAVHRAGQRLERHRGEHRRRDRVVHRRGEHRKRDCALGRRHRARLRLGHEREGRHRCRQRRGQRVLAPPQCRKRDPGQQ
ncbi:MAG: hypothetical protein IPJ41_01430 [Phycisphaerales bacterium]|nr:hypothetical protein [Phycisphaerales bacterium]